MDLVYNKAMDYFGDNKECKLAGYSESKQYALAKAYQIDGVLKHRVINCDEKERVLVVMLTTKQLDKSSSKVSGIIYRYSKDKSSFNASYYLNDLLTQFDSFLEPHWSVYFNDIDESDDYKWKTYFRKNGVVYEIPTPFLMESEKERYAKVLQARQKLIKSYISQ
jgi:hypothetical protein